MYKTLLEVHIIQSMVCMIYGLKTALLEYNLIYNNSLLYMYILYKIANVFVHFAIFHPVSHNFRILRFNTICRSNKLEFFNFLQNRRW